MNRPAPGRRARRRRSAGAALGLLALCAWPSAVPAAADSGPPAAGRELASVSSGGAPADAPSQRLALDGDGRRAVFASNAGNLVRGVHDGRSHLYLRDRRAGRTTLVDRGRSGAPADANSWDPRLSGDGRYAVFVSDARNLVPGVHDGRAHVYLADLLRHRTTVADAGPDGRAGDGDALEPSISPDGRAVVFMSDAPSLSRDGSTVFQVYEHTVGRPGLTRVSTGAGGAVPDGTSYGPAVSDGGRYVAFASLASDLVTGDTNKVSDIFVRDLARGTTVRVSTGPGGVQGDRAAVGATISGDGQSIGFASHASDLAPGLPSGDISHAYVHSLRSGTTRLLDTGPDGKPGNAGATWTGVSADGRAAVFMSTATNLGATGGSGVWNVFSRDLATGRTRLVSSGAGGAEADGDSCWPVLSGDARTVGYLSYATDLLPGKPAGGPGIYLEPADGSGAGRARPAPRAAGSPVRAANDRWLQGSAHRRVPAGGGELEVSGAAHLTEPYLAYFAVFAQNASAAVWHGPRPARQLRLVDEWRIDYFGDPFTVAKAPPGAEVSTGRNSLTVRTESVAGRGASRVSHAWKELDFMPAGSFAEIYRVRHVVTAVARIGGRDYRQEVSSSAFTW